MSSARASATLRKLRYKLIYTLMRHMTPSLYDNMLRMGLISFHYTRPMIVLLKQVFANKPLVGVEIGVAEGKNAEYIFKMLNIAHLYLIDPYEDYFENGHLVTRYTNIETVMKSTLKPFWNRIIFLKLKSQDAISMIPQVDFVYIDGNHEYEAVKKDIELYAPKVRLGGFIGGHDMYASGVAKAVQEYATHNRLFFIDSSLDWYIQLGFNAEYLQKQP